MKIFLTGSYDEAAINETKAQLEERSHEVVSHLDLAIEKLGSREAIDIASSEELFRMDVEQLLKSDGIALLPGWKKTKLVKNERLFAIRLGMFADTAEAFLDPDNLIRHKTTYECSVCGVTFARGRGRPPVVPLCPEHDYLKVSRRKAAEIIDPPERDDEYYERIAEFWAFAVERHKIYHKRLNGDPPPWTQDKLLATRQFTNIYRDLDPGTVAFRKWITPKKKRTVDDVAYWALAYRITNHEEILDRRSLPERDPKAVSEWVTALQEDERAGYQIQPSTHRATGYQRIRAALTGACFDLNISSEETAEDAWYNIKSFYGFGPFYATQVLSDVLDDETSPWDRDSFIPTALGSTRALWYISRGEITKSSAISRRDVISDLDFTYRELHDAQPGPDEIDGPPLTFVDIEHTLCEFSKYKQAPLSKGTGKLRLFSPTKRR